jgi:hypothetical protein
MLKTFSSGTPFFGHMGGGHIDSLHDPHGGMNEYYPCQNCSLHGQIPPLLPEMERYPDVQPICQNEQFTPINSPANPMPFTAKFEAGVSSSPLLATSTLRVQAPQFTVTISPRKSLVAEVPAENSRLTEVITDEVSGHPSNQPTT